MEQVFGTVVGAGLLHVPLVEGFGRGLLQVPLPLQSLLLRHDLPLLLQLPAVMAPVAQSAFDVQDMGEPLFCLLLQLPGTVVEPQ